MTTRPTNPEGREREPKDTSRVYSPPEFGYLRQDEEVADLAGNLPHWRQEFVTYFVTFRLADSMPKAKIQQWLQERGAWLASHPRPWDDRTRQEFHRCFTARIEKWLDAGYGSCMLARPDIRLIVTSALRHFENDRYWLDAWIAMPNHVHVIVTPCPGSELSDILQGWKSYTSHQILKRLTDWRGAFWQKESFDHIVRGPEHLERFRAYIVNNAKGLPPSHFTLCEPDGAW